MKTLILTSLFFALLAGCGRSPGREAERRRARSAGAERAASAAGRPVVYAYSVVAGGVGSAEDVREAMGRDPEVAAHYAGVDVGRLRAGHFDRDTKAYVSFRKAGRVYWTRRKVHIAAGEAILSDGENCVRGRCGNRVSWTPRSPTLPAGEREPESEELITPAVRGRSMEELAVEPVIGELMLGANGLGPSVGWRGVVVPGFVGGVVAGPGSSGSGSGGGGGDGGGGFGPGSAVGDGSYITGGPVFVVPPGVSVPVVPPVVTVVGPRGPAPVEIHWNPVTPYVPAQINVGQPWIPPAGPHEPARIWTLREWTPVPPVAPNRPEYPAPPGPRGEEPRPEGPEDCPPVVLPDRPDVPVAPASSEVPEPGTGWGVVGVLGGLWWWKRRAGV